MIAVDQYRKKTPPQIFDRMLNKRVAIGRCSKERCSSNFAKLTGKHLYENADFTLYLLPVLRVRRKQFPIEANFNQSLLKNENYKKFTIDKQQPVEVLQHLAVLVSSWSPYDELLGKSIKDSVDVTGNVDYVCAIRSLKH